MAGALIPVDALDDARLALFRLSDRGLSDRIARRIDDDPGLFLAEGDLVVERALDAGCEPVAALADEARVPPVAARLDIDVHVAGENLRRLVTGLGLPQPIVAVFRRPRRPSAAQVTSTCSRLVVLEGVDNPANVGSIVRNAAGLGWDGLLLDHTSADPLARRALRVAMGTVFELPHARSGSLHDDLADAGGLTIVALTPAGDASDIDEVTIAGRRALLIGSERAGLSADLLALADVRVRIPMAAGVDSLNVAAAAAIACFVLRR